MKTRCAEKSCCVVVLNMLEGESSDKMKNDPLLHRSEITFVLAQVDGR
jgi:hypothetical protein